jgi:serine/threonine protein phosphatase PrpC
MAPIEATHRLGRLRLALAAGSDVGRRYRANFDVVHLDMDLPVAVVADGMGDGRGSAIAGRTAVDGFTAAARAAAPLPDAGGLRAAVADIQRRVGRAGTDLGELTGCTLTALVACPPDSAWIVHIGDSRAYRLRDGLLEQLTVDHTMAWIGVLNGWYAHESHEAARARYHLTRFIGHPQRPEPDLLHVALRPGDRFCLCTDGIAEQVPYERLAQVLGADRPPKEMVARLLADAAAAGGSDNATAAVLTVA